MKKVSEVFVQCYVKYDDGKEEQIVTPRWCSKEGFDLADVVNLLNKCGNDLAWEFANCFKKNIKQFADSHVEPPKVMIKDLNTWELEGG